MTDTIKRVDAGRAVLETLERGSLWAVQTPQVFRRAALERALAVGEDVLASATDEAWLVERSGGRRARRAARRENLKVTTPRDLGRPHGCSRGARRDGVRICLNRSARC